MCSIIVFGASGFGGAPCTRAIKESHPDWLVTAYVRSTKPENELKANLNADRITVGDFSDFEKVEKASNEHGIAVNAGNSFTADPVAAIIAGQKEKKGASKGIVIHINGGGNFIDFGTSRNFNPESKSDTPVLKAGAANAVDTYIVCPSIVYGGASISSSSIGVGYSLVTGNAKPLGYVPYVGDGTAIVSTCHVLDLTNFLVKISDLAAQGPAPGTAYSRYYMLETSRVSWKEMATELANAIHARGICSSPQPKNVPEGEVKHLVAANMLIKATMHEDLKEVAI